MRDGQGYTGPKHVSLQRQGRPGRDNLKQAREKVKDAIKK